MRTAHEQVFFDVADQLTCWIGVREPNPLSDRWIDWPGGVPKPLECRAKTADNPLFRFSGLVVDPTLCPEGFKDVGAATATWNNNFLQAGHLPPAFTCCEHEPERGLVRLWGSLLFADFDLMAICRATENGDFLFTSHAEQSELFEGDQGVQATVNEGLGVPMIQHGAEMMYDEGVGGRELEDVLWFGPGRRFNRWPSSMPGPHGPGGGH